MLAARTAVEPDVVLGRLAPDEFQPNGTDGTQRIAETRANCR